MFSHSTNVGILFPALYQSHGILFFVFVKTFGGVTEGGFGETGKLNHELHRTCSSPSETIQQHCLLTNMTTYYTLAKKFTKYRS